MEAFILKKDLTVSLSRKNDKVEYYFKYLDNSKFKKIAANLIVGEDANKLLEMLNKFDSVEIEAFLIFKNLKTVFSQFDMLTLKFEVCEIKEITIKEKNETDIDELFT